jgi:hypothetical protein
MKSRCFGVVLYGLQILLSPVPHPSPQQLRNNVLRGLTLDQGVINSDG